MDELINDIEETVAALIRYDVNRYTELAQGIANKMMILFPAIIDTYNDPRMQDLREDAVYWPEQLERIIKAFDKGDNFEVIDVLYNETRENLIELKNTLAQRGLI